jgi:hypothetical protein
VTERSGDAADAGDVPADDEGLLADGEEAGAGGLVEGRGDVVVTIPF